ncbi:hypothetical protein J8273_4269 [Carpediemonas membranifera]|uniref:Lysosomal dipeptide transporter MFSD1 n=1 Tax=Carpediemonas membranifera TaxID=201153 RepID=A0A8J6BBW7_9EUKA|nr:hypothetical protein J8273_4269 [Carpediemonas membranifera]|eukprot:KAG9394167.1 hypothetical protein J8273_4269 [Carpediemonas membranifera]
MPRRSHHAKLKPRKSQARPHTLLSRLNPLHFRKHIRIWVFLALFCAQDFLTSFANDSFYALSAYYRESYNMSPLQISVLSSIYSLPNMIMPYLFGILVDKLGGSKLYITSGAFIIISMVISALSGLPSSSTVAFALVFISRVILAIGGQSIYTSHDVLHVKVFGPLVSLTLSLGISFGKIGSTSVFLVNSAVADRFGLGAACMLTSLLTMPVAVVIILIVALHASDTRKKKHCMKTTGQVSVVITAGSIPVRVDEYATEDEDDYLFLSSYPQTPAEFRSDVEMAQDAVLQRSPRTDYPQVMGPEPDVTETAPAAAADETAAEYIFTETMESRLEVATMDGTLEYAEAPVEEGGAFIDEYGSALAGDATFETVPIDPYSEEKIEDAETYPVGGLPESDTDATNSGDDAPMPFGSSLMTALMEQLEGGADSDSEVEANVAIALRSRLGSSPFASPFFWVQALSCTMAYLLFYTFPSVSPVIFMARNGISSGEASTATSFFYGGMIITPVWVIFTTKIGHRVTLTIASCVLSCIVFLLLLFTTLSPSFMALLLGIGASVLGSAVYSAFTLTVKTSATGKAFGLINSLINAAYFISMFLLSMVASASWRLCLLLYVGMSVISAALAVALFAMDLQYDARLALPQKKAVAKKLEQENR